VGKLRPAVAVLVVTKQAIDRHGYDNVEKHVENLKMFGVPIVIAINKKVNDAKHDLDYIQKNCSRFGVKCVVSEVWGKGGRGGKELARAVIDGSAKKSKFKFLYDLEANLRYKIEIVANDIYGAEGVNFTDEAARDLEIMERIGMSELPVCIAKTQSSLSDNARVYGRPTGFKINVRGLKPSAGAGFVVAYTGAIMTMPGLPLHPAAENMDITEDGKIKGLF
jgi:formate--tetrahydrofolate ligase